MFFQWSDVSKCCGSGTSSCIILWNWSLATGSAICVLYRYNMHSRSPYNASQVLRPMNMFKCSCGLNILVLSLLKKDVCSIANCGCSFCWKLKLCRNVNNYNKSGYYVPYSTPSDCTRRYIITPSIDQCVRVCMLQLFDSHYLLTDDNVETIYQKFLYLL